MSLTGIPSSCISCVSICVVVRLEKLKPKLPKLNIIPANEAYDEDYIRLMRANQPSPSPSPTPSPSPQPVEYIDPDFDPDNMVIHGAPITDDEDYDENDGNDMLRKASEMDNFSFKTHS